MLRERESTKKTIFSESFINGFSDLGLEPISQPWIIGFKVGIFTLTVFYLYNVKISQGGS